MLVLVIGVVLGVMRPFFVGREVNKHLSQSYQAVSHIVVGWLLGVWWFEIGTYEGWLLLGLTVVEIACALVSFAMKMEVVVDD